VVEWGNEVLVIMAIMAIYADGNGFPSGLRSAITVILVSPE